LNIIVDDDITSTVNARPFTLTEDDVPNFNY